MENKKDENNPVNLLALTNFDLEAAENAKKHASQNSDHICIILNGNLFFLFILISFLK